MDRRFFILLLIWALVAVVSLGLGRYHIGLGDLLATIFGRGSDDVMRNVLFNIRIPRVLISSICGGALAIAGVCLQGLFRSPLVDAKIIGVSTGAAFGGCVAILLGFAGSALVGFAFGFGLLALGLLYVIAGFVRDRSIFTLVLAGIVINGFFAALISLVQYLADNEETLPNIVFWLLGSFVNANYARLGLVAAVAIPCIVLLFAMRWNLNLLSLDENDLRTMGVRVGLIRTLILLTCTLLIATQVAVSGNIGWVGLVVPHMARLLSGADHLRSVPCTFIIGMIFMLIVDDVARVATASEIPLGILCALIGTPVFAILLKRSARAA